MIPGNRDLYKKGNIMSLKDLSEHYGNKKGEQLVNDAIRAELPGGNEMLDAVNLAPQVRAACNNEKKDLAEKLCSLLYEGSRKMKKEIARRYDLKRKGEKDE